MTYLNVSPKDTLTHGGGSALLKVNKGKVGRERL